MKYLSLLSLFSLVYGYQYIILDLLEIEDNNEKKDFQDEHFEFSNFEIENDEVKVETTSKNYEIEYEIESKDTDPIVSKLKYKSTNSSGFETETKSRVLIHGIQEWFDENYDGLMQDNEKIGSLYFVGDNEYETITYNGPDNYEIYNFTISEKPLGFLTMIAYLTSNFTEYYYPNSMKFDIIIQDWIYQNSENQLALLMEYRTEDQMETDEDEYVSQKTTTPSLGYAALQWNKTIIYDYLNIGNIQTRMLDSTELNSLINTDDEYEGEQSSGMWFCFSSKGASVIYWDPSMGVYTTPLSSTSSSSSSSKNTLSVGEIAVIIVTSILGSLTFSILCYSKIIRKMISKENVNKFTESDTDKLTVL
jgi:hypothetical protein